MKTNRIALTIALLLCFSVGSLSVLGQNSKPDQAKLLQQFVGKWRGEVGKDTLIYKEFKSFGTAIDGLGRTEVKGKIVQEQRQVFGYNSKTDRLTEADVTKGSDMEIWACWFTSDTRMIGMPADQAHLGEKAPLWVEILIKPGKSYQQKIYQNGKLSFTKTMVRTGD
jgi:hypothetical protein